MGASDLNPDTGVKLTPMTAANMKRHAKSRAKRRKASLATALRRRNWTVPLILMSGFLLVYAINPTESNPAYPFILLSYKLEGAVDGSSPAPQYGKGLRDIAFVCFYTIFLTFTREFCMQEIFTPLGRTCGITSRAKRARFAENMYTALYIAIIGPWGMYLMRRTPVWYFNTHGMYEGFPHRTHEAGFKAYYLLQAAFWMQQVVVMVLGLEARRKDFSQLIGHHIVTVALVALSYRFHFAYMGIAVYITHDISDFFLSVSKSLNYLENKAQGWSFGLCIVMWIYLRHYINLRILYSALPGGEFSTVGPYGPIDWEAEQYKSPLANVITFSLLAALQSLNIFWLYCLLRSAYKFVFLGVAKDDRSEAEDEGEEAESMVTVVGDVDVPAQVAGNGPIQGLVQRKSGQV
ncbi:TLC domain-containing protein [Triangularia setosa]|uniref:TLC domain-containing protein n=1 Tax=Triangularia setosa TaxID=2587417 RepID=A0AAN6WFF4_9PEZI|nr:TLC domain-containing protein [Podospora setosa]